MKVVKEEMVKRNKKKKRVQRQKMLWTIKMFEFVSAALVD